MKIIIIGLGNFGANLGIQLMKDEHEVFGIDNNMSLVEKYSTQFTATMAMDTTDEETYLQLPFRDTDIVVIAIGEDVGASLSTIALVKKHFNKRIIARAINDVHLEIVRAMNVTEIVQPEVDYANDLSNRILIPNAIKSMDLPDKYEIIEVVTPEKLIGQNIREIDAKHVYNVYIITAIKNKTSKNFLGNSIEKMSVTGILPPDYVIERDDVLLIFGKSKDITNFIQKFS